MTSTFSLPSLAILLDAILPDRRAVTRKPEAQLAPRLASDDLREIMSRCPEAMNSEAGMMMAMSVYPRAF